jgi:SAM-dependent methyltransferase
MWRIESTLDDARSPYDRRAAMYDRLVRSRLYNRIAWSTSPEDYSNFAAEAFASAEGPLLEVAVGSAAATASLHARSRRTTMLIDLSRAMLERAGRNIAAAAGGSAHVFSRIRLVQADLRALPPPDEPFTTVLGLGLTHLFEDLPALVRTLQAQLAPDGWLYLSGLVAETIRGRRYLDLLHRAGEVTAPKSAAELRDELHLAEHFNTVGCMAYVTIGAAVEVQ